MDNRYLKKISIHETPKVLQATAFAFGCLQEVKLWPFFPHMCLWYVFVSCVQYGCMGVCRHMGEEARGWIFLGHSPPNTLSHSLSQYLELIVWLVRNLACSAAPVSEHWVYR